MHISVLVEEVLEYLNLRPGIKILDATVGLGGHSKEVLRRILPGGGLIAMDRDEASLKVAKEALYEFKENIRWVHGNFRDLSSHLRDSGVEKVDGVLMDLGISSYQLSEAERGFSFLQEGPLDMRMNPSGGISAREVINKMPEDQLSRILFEYGEERHSRRIAKAISQYRKRRPLQTTLQLSRLVQDAVGGYYRGQKIHPATRTFQAIRIYVNDELNSLEGALGQAIDVLNPGGRLVVISFHSLEDGFVKRTFRSFSRLRGGKKGGSGIVNILTRKPVRPSLNEIRSNTRARSARLRAVEKI